MYASSCYPTNPAPRRLPGVRRVAIGLAAAGALTAVGAGAADTGGPMHRQTIVSIQGQAFHVNGQPTYAGRTFRGCRLDGLLMNARLVQGVFDDRNPETRQRWHYPDGPWDPERNTREFVTAMPTWRQAGLLGFTINLQGGSPEGYSRQQPWHNSGIEPDGSLHPDYLARLERILDRADELGMVPILGLFYFGQAHRLRDEAAVGRAVENAVDWLLARRYTNVLIEIGNEVNHPGYPPLLQPDRCGDLIRLVQTRSAGRVGTPAGRLLVSTSLTGGRVPPDSVAAVADFLLLHGNGVGDPRQIARLVDACRALPGYHDQPILFNEDDHFGFDQPDNNMLAAVRRYAGWGYFDFRLPGEGYDEGYQSVPVNWGVSSARKRGFFTLLAEMTGGQPPP